MKYKVRVVPPGPHVTVRGHKVEDGSYTQLDVHHDDGRLVLQLDYEFYPDEAEELVRHVLCCEEGLFDLRKTFVGIKKDL